MGIGKVTSHMRNMQACLFFFGMVAAVGSTSHSQPFNGYLSMLTKQRDSSS